MYIPMQQKKFLELNTNTSSYDEHVFSYSLL